MNAPLPRALARKLQRFTRSSGAEPAGPDVVVLGQPGDPIEDVLRIACDLQAGGSVVRVIAPGVTLERAWPAWFQEHPGVTLTEWGALQYASQAEMTMGLQEEMRGWIRRIAPRTFGGSDADRALFAAACLRFFQSAVVGLPIARAIAWAFPGAVVRTAPRSRPLDATQQLVGSATGHARRVPTGKVLRWRAQIIVLGFAAIAGSAAREVAAYVGAQPTFWMLAALRRRAPRDRPETWVGLVPDWYRINHHLLGALALPLTDDDGTIGVLLIATLASGLRDEARMRTHHRSDHPWPGLGKLVDRLDHCAVEQVVVPESPLEFARALSRGLARSVALLRRLATSPLVRLPSAEIDLSSWAAQVATWATVDVVRATLAQAAATALTARLPFAGTTVSLSASNLSNIAAADLVLQQRGATTFDSAHGFLADSWTAQGSSSSSIRCFWTAVEGEPPAVSGQRRITTGMPIQIRVAPRTGTPRRILVMSNYVHRDSSIGGRHPLAIFQDELLAVVALLQNSGHADKEFRWRPHPADDPKVVALERSKHPRLDVSVGKTLQEDAAWADVIISSISSTVIETLFAGVPVFVHALPEYWDTPLTSFIEPQRMFFHAADGARSVADWLARYSPDPGSGLEAERRARIALFGETGEPIPMTDYLGRGRTRPLPAA